MSNKISQVSVNNKKPWQYKAQAGKKKP